MKILYDFYPVIGNTSSVTFTSSVTAQSVFPVTNLFFKEPARCFKTSGVSSFNITMDLKSNKNINMIFLNRINFSEYTVSYSTDNSTYIQLGNHTGLKKDEITEEEYIHDCFYIPNGITARYIRISVPANKTVFDSSCYKIGNFFVGKCEDVSNPKNGFQVKYQPNMNITKFKSGYISKTRLGRTNRIFSGDFDKLSTDELAKFKLTYNPFILWLEYTEKTSDCYFVMNTEEYAQTYDYAKVKSMNFNLEEIV